MRRYALAVVWVLMASWQTSLLAADESTDPTGTWKWSFTFMNQTREATLKLKLEGDKLTGTILGPNNQETAIENASCKDGEVAFTVTREFNGQKFTRKFKGKVSGDTIKGTIEVERDGQTRSREWEAKREKA